MMLSLIVFFLVHFTLWNISISVLMSKEVIAEEGPGTSSRRYIGKKKPLLSAFRYGFFKNDPRLLGDWKVV